MQNRWKSPVVWIQAITAIVTCVIFFVPEFTGQIKAVTVLITSLISIFSAANNPENGDGF